MMILVKIPILVLFLTFFTACHLFSSKPDAPSKEALEAESLESSPSSDEGQPVSPQPENTQSGHINLPTPNTEVSSSSSVQASPSPSVQALPSDQKDSSTTQVSKTPPSRAQLEAFFAAVKRNDLRQVDLALKAGADPTVPDEEGNTAIMMAVDRGYIALVIIFLRDASVSPQALNHTNAEGYTALTLSVGRGNLEIMTLLLEAGADPMHPGSLGYTPLFMAVVFNEVVLARRLLDIPQVRASINREEIHYNNNSEEKDLMLTYYCCSHL